MLLAEKVMVSEIEANLCKYHICSNLRRLESQVTLPNMSKAPLQRQNVFIQI
jgi:hypothetical protein